MKVQYILGTILTILAGASFYYNFMIQFMGVFFIVVAVLKMLDYKGFVHHFQMYDILAKRSKVYAYAYPIIEFSLGSLYITQTHVQYTAMVTVIIMLIGAVGVGQQMGKKMRCACLGTLVNIPLTEFTLYEDILMALMALMLI